MKYFSKKVEYNGVKFDSMKELQHWLQLKKMEEDGLITDLQRQVKFELIPKQYDKNGKFLYHPINYIADMCYFNSDGEYVVEDVKSKYTRTLQDYKMKKKLLYYTNGIVLREVI